MRLKLCKKCFTMKNINGNKLICKRCEEKLGGEGGVIFAMQGLGEKNAS